MILRLLVRHLAQRPVRSLVFVGAYAAGVGVMLLLLSIGAVMVEQASDEEWVGGGDLTVLPAGVDLETLRMGGAVFYGLEGARYIALQVLGGPRLAHGIEAFAPWIDGRAVYLRRPGRDSTVAVRADAQIPSAARALGAAPELTAGRWEDTPEDRRWLRPTPIELYSAIDAFHRPAAGLRADTTWAEWHYFNLLWPEEGRWLYLSYIRAGAPGDRSAGLLLATYRTPDGRSRTFTDSVPGDRVRVSETRPDVVFGPHTVELLDDPVRYRVRADLPGAEGGAGLRVELELSPAPHRYFPPIELAASDSFLSGYVVPALRARATGRICEGDDCRPADAAIGYHDHNWGTWAGVTWDWGIAHAGGLDVLYGGIERADDGEVGPGGAPAYIVYVVDSLGAAGVLSMSEVRQVGGELREIEGDSVAVPERLVWTAARGPDSLTATIEVEHSALTPVEPSPGRRAYFVQMQGELDLRGRLGGRAVAARGPGFFETYVWE